MKVYELIAQLSKMPAGAEVEVNSLMTIKEFIKDGPFNNCNGEDMYLLNKAVTDATEKNENLVHIHLTA